MADNHERYLQVDGTYIHLPQAVGEEPELTPSQIRYLKTSMELGKSQFQPEEVNVPADALVDPTNPKDLIGIKKPNLFLVPPTAEIYLALAFADGAAKYGPYNWREKEVRASVYIAALKRHVADWVDGQNDAEDSGVPHLGHAMACLAIIADALETGNLVDDRPEPGAAPELLAHYTKG